MRDDVTSRLLVPLHLLHSAIITEFFEEHSLFLSSWKGSLHICVSSAGCFIKNCVSVSKTTSSMLSSCLPFLRSTLNNFFAIATAVYRHRNKTWASYQMTKRESKLSMTYSKIFSWPSYNPSDTFFLFGLLSFTIWNIVIRKNGISFLRDFS